MARRGRRQRFKRVHKSPKIDKKIFVFKLLLKSLQRNIYRHGNVKINLSNYIKQ